MAGATTKMLAVIRKGGDMILKDNHSIPTCGEKEVLVKVKGAAINPVDYKFGWPIMGPVAGLDFSGIVEKIGPKVEKIEVGDEVFGTTKKGALAEMTVANPEEIAIKPKSFSFAEAAAMPTAYLTSLQGLRDYGEIKGGDRVLVIGASGGCGISAIQLAKTMGASDIVGICSGRNQEFVKSLGATHVVDYTKEDIVDYCSSGDGKIEESKKFDIVYDAATGSGAGEDYKAKSLKLLKEETEESKHGQYVAINGGVEDWLRTFTIGHKKNQHLMVVQWSKKEDLEYLANLVDSEEGTMVKPVLAEVLSLSEEDVQKGFTLLKSRRTVGKIVFEINKTD